MKMYFIFLPAVFFCLCSCGTNNDSLHKAPAKAGIAENPSCAVPKKINIEKTYVYDLSGYEDEGGSRPFNLFDENAYVDPGKENRLTEHYIPVTNPQPVNHPSIYFPLNKGNRIVVDLQVPYKITEVYLYDRSPASDSVWIYTGTMLNWKLKLAFITKGDAGQWGWRKFSLDDSSRYVMIRFNSYETALTEMVMYGCPYKAIPPPQPTTYSGPRLPKKMMRDFLGVNYFNDVDPKWVKPFHYSRLYSFAVDFDKDTLHAYPDVKYNMLFNAYWNGNINDYDFFLDKIVKENNGIVWRSLAGKPLWMQKKEYDRLRPVTQPSMDPEDPLSYARHGNMMFNISGYFGHSKTDTSLLSFSFGPKKSGKGMMNLYENGNEDDAVWIGESYCNPIEYFALSSADFDGHEGLLGGKVGIRNADSNARLITSGMIGLDTNRVRVYKFLCNTLRKDKKFIWDGGIQYHHYSTNGRHGITPEEDSLRWKLEIVRDATYRIQPGVECILGENGYDKSQKSRQGVPLIPGLSEEQCQGIFLLRSINAVAFSGFDAYILYWLRDEGVSEDDRVYLTCGIFRERSGNMEPLAAWFHISTFVNVLGSYVADKVISEQGNVWVYKYRNQSFPDSVAYFVYCPTHQGKVVRNYPLKVGRVSSYQANEIIITDNSVNGKVNKKDIVNGIVEISAEEKPKIILVREKH